LSNHDHEMTNQQWILKGRTKSGLATRITATESVSLCVRMES